MKWLLWHARWREVKGRLETAWGRVTLNPTLWMRGKKNQLIARLLRLWGRTRRGWLR